MTETRYTKEHEWIRLEEGLATVGISNYAQEQLGDVVYVELPEIGRKVESGDDMAVVESVKAASEVYAPIAGEVAEVNEELAAKPEIINEDAEGAGWFVKLSGVEPGDLAELMNEDAYRKYVESLD